MKKILCPTDFSDTASNAVAYAAKLAQAIKADLTLFHVESIFDLAPAEVLRGEIAYTQIAERLNSLSLEVSKAFKISCYAETELGSRQLSSVINEKAKSYDLIVMGSNGADDLYQFFTGSNTYNTTLKTRTPLLLIPANCVYSEIKSLIFAFDYFHEKNLPFGGITPFVKKLGCRLKILQVMAEPYSRQWNKDLREVESDLKRFYNDFEYEFDTIRSDEIAQSINSYMSRNQADVLALCSVQSNFIKRLFHKSVIKSISNYCNYPLYVFHQ
ncbi:MAG TPA: universal stress protein [Cyclobacteriaceae bacterium]|nr:universal stress protein [Cyclobacteriaceae bacterium]